MDLVYYPADLKKRCVELIAISESMPADMLMHDTDIKAIGTKIMLSCNDDSVLPWNKREYDKNINSYRLSIKLNNVEIFKYSREDVEQ